jgi:anaerobic dimethyl sulfoxide reductase subunit A
MMDTEDTVIIPTGACHDCGGRCVIKVHVKDGVAVRVETDDGEEPQLRACARGRAYRKRVYDPNRLKYPMKRVGKRGEGKFQRISWDEALDTVARELLRVKEKYGPSAILDIDYSGAAGQFHRPLSINRLLTMFGGYTTHWGGASGEGSVFASRSVYGTLTTGHNRDDHVNSRLIIMWGWNPTTSTWSTNTPFHLVQAKEAGARIVCIDPRFTDSAAVLADQWIPVRPGTDAAMMVAMAYVMITENLHDQQFLDKYTLGFDRFKDYVMGVDDGEPKIPSWAETITGVPAQKIADLAWEYATLKPSALIASFAPGRTAYGEQYHRLATTLTAMTGNIGIHGGGAGGFERGPVVSMVGPVMPPGKNPVEASLPSMGGSLDSSLRSRARPHFTQLWNAILRGKAGGYPSDTRLIYITCSNCLNQFPNTNKGIQALEKVEFIIVHEQFMTPTARFADILLPVNTIWERNDITRPWLSGDYYIYMNKVIDSMYESKSDFDICCELASRLGITNYSEKTEEEWIKEIIRISPDMSRDVTDYDTFKKDGVHKLKFTEPQISFKEQIEDPENNPFPTPSGKIEIYSQRLADLENPELPPVPKYIETWESVNDSLANKYPLQLITTHHKTRAHSCFDNIPWLKSLEPQMMWINSTDANARGISDGEEARIFNERGEVILPARVTERIMPGVVSIDQGAWYMPDKSGVDRGGCCNLLTRDHYSPGGGFPGNTCLVQVKKIAEK